MEMPTSNLSKKNRSKKMQPLTRMIPLYLNTIRVLSEY